MTSDDDGEDTDELARGKLTTATRLQLLERDSRNHARSLTEIVAKTGKFTPEQLEQLHAVFREELADVGLRIDEDHIDEARADFRFLRGLRRNLNGMAAGIGWTIIAALLGTIIWLLTLGANTWRGP